MRILYAAAVLIAAFSVLYGGDDIRSDSGPEQKISVSTRPELSPEGKRKARAMTEFFLFLNGAAKSEKGKVTEEQFTHLLNAVKSDPDSRELLMFAASVLRSDPKTKTARLDALTEIAKDQPDKTALNLIVAAFLGHREKDEKIFRQNVEKAISLLEHSRKFARNDEEDTLRRHLAMLHASIKQYESADELLEKSFRLGSKRKRAELYQTALSVYLEALKDASDEKPFPFGWFGDSPRERYAKKFQKTLDLFSEYLKDPENEWNPENLTQSAEILRSRGKEDLALLILASPLFSNPKNLRAMKRLASYYFVSKDYANSARLWKMILAGQRNPPPYDYLVYGQSLLNCDRAKEACQVFLILMKRFPKISLPPNIFTVAAFLAGKYRTVVQFVNRFRNPTPQMLYLKASAEAQMGNYSAALDSMMKYLPLIKEKNPEIHRTRAIQAVLFAEKAKRYETAAEILNPIIKQNPENPEMLNLLGYLYADAGIHLDQAEDLLKKALKADPENPAILDSMAWLLYRKKNFKSAWKYIRESMDQSKKKNQEMDGVILDHAGDIAMKLGLKKEAAAFWKASLSIYSPETNRAEILKKLKKLER